MYVVATEGAESGAVSRVTGDVESIRQARLD